MGQLRVISQFLSVRRNHFKQLSFPFSMQFFREAFFQHVQHGIYCCGCTSVKFPIKKQWFQTCSPQLRFRTPAYLLLFSSFDDLNSLSCYFQFPVFFFGIFYKFSQMLHSLRLRHGNLLDQIFSLMECCATMLRKVILSFGIYTFRKVQIASFFKNLVENPAKGPKEGLFSHR